jgi:hypothetical protein
VVRGRRGREGTGAVAFASGAGGSRGRFAADYEHSRSSAKFALTSVDNFALDVSAPNPRGKRRDQWCPGRRSRRPNGIMSRAKPV